MDYSAYSETALEYMQKIQGSRMADIPETLGYSRRLLKYAKEQGNLPLEGYASYYLAECYFFQNNYIGALSRLNSAVPGLMVKPDYYHLTRCYNLYGILYSVQGNIPDALENYFTSISYTKQSNDIYMEAIATSNIAIIYFGLEDYKNAARYHKRALTLLKKNSPHSDKENILQTMSSLGLCYCNLSLLKKAHSIKESLMELLPQCSSPHSLSEVYLFLASYFHQTHNYLSRDFYIGKAIHTARSMDNFLNSVDDYQAFCRFLLQIGQLDAFAELYAIIEQQTGRISITHIHFQSIRLWVSYLKQSGQQELLPKALERYYYLSRAQEQYEQHAAYCSMKMRIAYENALKSQQKLERQKEKMKEKSETDFMTGLPNRFRLNDYLEQAFMEAQERQSPLAIELLDVDHFKEYNDTYGHLAGDECLRCLAAELLAMMGDEVFCARYGGDEFILVYTGKSRGEVSELAEGLRARVAAWAGKNGKQLTISQGICYGIPAPGSRAWDFLFQADIALYRLKKESRDAVILTEPGVPI